MEAVVVPLHLGASDMGVHLGRGYVGVAEHLLDGANIGVILDQMGRKRVSECVRRNAGKPYFTGYL